MAVVGREKLVVGLAVVASERVFGSTPSVEASLGIKASGDLCKSENLSRGTPKCEADKNECESEVRAACHLLESNAAGASSLIPTCPNCSPAATKIYRDGLRTLQGGGEVQRWLCQKCGFRFSGGVVQSLNSSSSYTCARQICAEGAKNLHATNIRKVGAGEISEEIKALIKVFEGWLQKEGYKKNCYPNNLKTLVHLGADLMNSEDVKAKIGAHNVRDGMKMMLCYSYDAFVTMHNDAAFLKNMGIVLPKLSWEKPTCYKQDEIIPFIPEEAELDQLIVATRSRRMAAYLQTLKETFTDPGEALPIEWKDIEGNYIAIRHPVKNHRPRTLEVSPKLIAMINMLPHKSERVFGYSYSTVSSVFKGLKKRLAANTHNNRFVDIEMRSYRHWAGTRIAELSNGNACTVMKMLGLRNIENAMKYVNIWKLSFRTETDYEFLEVTTPEDLKVALLGGYQHVIDKFGASWFRRAKRIAFAGTPIDEREPEKTPMPSTETLVNKQKTPLKNLY